jgi:hypothetical protein
MDREAVFNKTSCIIKQKTITTGDKIMKFKLWVITASLLAFNTILAANNEITVQPKFSARYDSLQVSCAEDSAVLSSLRRVLSHNTSKNGRIDNRQDLFQEGVDQISYSILESGAIELKISFSDKKFDSTFTIMKDNLCTVATY